MRDVCWVVVVKWLAGAKSALFNLHMLVQAGAYAPFIRVPGMHTIHRQ